MSARISCNTTEEYNGTWCPPVYDNWLCWPATPPLQNRTMDCPLWMPGSIEGKAFRICLEGGSWDKNGEVTNSTKGHTHFEKCLLPSIVRLFDMCNKIKECPMISWNTRLIEMVVFRFIKYVDQGLNQRDRFIEGKAYVEETWTTMLEYTKTAMFVWMFIEGLYLHNMITVTVFQEYSYIKLYFYVGWIAPAIMTTAWVIAMLCCARSNWSFYYFRSQYWILEGPRSFIIAANLLFLINIIRVLIVKLRESRTPEIEQVRKAVRAAIFLLPLMGIANVFFWMNYYFEEAWKFALWSYTSYFLNTFQGFFVAVLYCFLNGEVQTAVKNSYYLHMSLRNYDYTSARNFTLVSTATEAEQEARPQIGRKSFVQNCLRHFIKTNEEKYDNVCTFNDDHHNPTTLAPLTLLDTHSLTSERPPDCQHVSDDATCTTTMNGKNFESKV